MKTNKPSLYLCRVPFIDDMGSISPFKVRDSFYLSKEEDALKDINSSRDHDGLPHLTKLPKGTTFTPIYENQ